LEVLRDWSGLVELPASEAAERIATLVNTSAVRVDKLVRAAATEPPRVRERLRRLLMDVGRPDAAADVPPARGRPIHRTRATASCGGLLPRSCRDRSTFRAASLQLGVS